MSEEFCFDFVSFFAFWSTCVGYVLVFDCLIWVFFCSDSPSTSMWATENLEELHKSTPQMEEFVDGVHLTNLAILGK